MKKIEMQNGSDSICVREGEIQGARVGKNEKAEMWVNRGLADK